MDNSTRVRVLAAAEELFTPEQLSKLSSSVADVKGRKSLRYWQEDLMAELSKAVGIVLTSKTHFIALFEGTEDKYAAPLSAEQHAELEEAKQQLQDTISEIAKKGREIARGGKRTRAAGVLQEPLNDAACRVGFEATFSLQEYAEGLIRRAEEDRHNWHSLHPCCELIRARHLGAKVPESRLKEVAGDSVQSAIESLISEGAKHDGWFRRLSEGLFLGAYFRMDSRLSRLCEWATPRRKSAYEATIEDEQQELALVMAGLFQKEFKAGFNRKLLRCCDSRKARIRLQADMLKAIRDDDQPAFEAATKKAIQNYRKRKTPDPSLALLSETLPAHINTAYYAGLCRGMDRADLAENLSAYLCRGWLGSEPPGVAPSV